MRANMSDPYPANTRKHVVKSCLRIVISEEWEHHRFVVRDSISSGS